MAIFVPSTWQPADTARDAGAAVTVRGLTRQFRGRAGAAVLVAAASLALWDLVTLPLAIAVFAVALRWARRQGRLVRG
jgi:hypothetical protein